MLHTIHAFPVESHISCRSAGVRFADEENQLKFPQCERSAAGLLVNFLVASSRSGCRDLDAPRRPPAHFPQWLHPRKRPWAIMVPLSLQFGEEGRRLFHGDDQP